MFTLATLLLLAAVSICGCSGNQSTYIVVCHYAVVDESGIQSDPAIITTYVQASNLDRFVELQKQLNNQPSDYSDHSNYVNRKLVRIRAAQAVLRPEVDHPEVKVLVGQEWQVVWRFTPKNS